MHEPNVALNWAAIAAAAVAAFVLGWAWYGPVFGRKWAAYMGINIDKAPEAKVMMRSLGLQLLGLVLTTFVLAHSVQIWRPSVWGLGADASDLTYGFFGGFFTWVGFYVPLQLSKVAWESKAWGLFAINAGHDFVNLQIMAQILAHWR